MNLPVLPARPDCKLCDLGAQAKSVGVPTVWYPKSLPPSKDTPAVIFLGQNPGAQEDAANEPFIGPSGRLVKEAYIAGIKLDTLATIYLANTARCWAPTPPRDRHYKCCVGFFRSDLDAIRATAGRLLVVCLGAPATKHLWQSAGEKNVSLRNGFARSGSRLPTYDGVTVFSTYHPAAILRTHSLRHIVHDHMQFLLDNLTQAPRNPSRPSYAFPGDPP